MTLLPDAVRHAESVLVSGPPMSGKYELLMRILAEWSEQPVMISTGRSAGKVREEYEQITDRSGDDLVVIDCASHEQGAEHADTPTTKYVASPGNLTDIGIKFTNVVESSAGLERAIGIHSLSQLLMYWEAERIYQFTRVMAAQSSGEGWPFVAVIGSETHDTQTIHTLHEPFELIVETRVTDDGRQFRTLDRVGGPTEWTDF
ncbi:DUF7504 family protein [Halorubrum vacuolatum]|uniref:RecA-superfamily ATPase, KaiC/GvpD/RAD55 family n=1 Tax=Halorubrum vacuolatum TaxID=63740 RepID=A0A238VUX2_HALVU|nr:hypothetical protein [Halorubrum vacuolatum]SNR37981.1 hypothetical protein SAMN06264855_10499 [Halorubrum vacuolatum]